MTTPYIGFGNDTLLKQPAIEPGASITCPKCGEQHPTADSTPPMILSFKCGDGSYIAAIKGPGDVYRSVLGVPADVKGEL